MSSSKAPALKDRPENVTNEIVEAAMERLEARGENVSVRAVAAEIGSGSLTTISKGIKFVRAKRVSPHAKLEEFPERLKDLCEEMFVVMGALAETRVQDEREQLAAAQKTVEDRWEGLVLEKESAVQMLEAEKRVNAELRAALDQQREANQASENKITGLLEQNQSLIVARATLETKIADRENQIVQLQQHVEHFTAQVEDQRRRTERNHKELTLQLSSRIAHLEQLLVQANTQHAEEKALLEKSKAELTHELNILGRKLVTQESEAISIQSQLNAAKAKLGETTNLLVEITVQNDKLQTKQDEAQALVFSMQNQAINDQASIVALQQRLFTMQQNLSDERDRMTADNKSVLRNMVEHSRKVYELADVISKSSTKKFTEELNEFRIAQREIEKLIT